MKQQIPTGAFIGIIIAIVALVGFLAFKVLGPHGGSTASAAEMKQKFAEHGVSGAVPPNTSGGRSGSGGSGGYPHSGGYSSSGGYPTSGGR